MSKEHVTVRNPKNGRLVWRNTGAQTCAEDSLLQSIYAGPLRAEFRGKSGITRRFSRFEHPTINFDDVYTLAKGLEARGLVMVTALGTATFDVTTTGDQKSG